MWHAKLTEFLDGKVRNQKKRGMDSGNFYYPEILGKIFIINAPFLFTALWKIAKLWIDKKTQAKVSILGGSYKNELLESIDKDMLPDYLGGKRVGTPKFPWDDYWNYSINKKKQSSILVI